MSRFKNMKRQIIAEVFAKTMTYAGIFSIGFSFGFGNHTAIAVSATVAFIGIILIAIMVFCDPFNIKDE